MASKDTELEKTDQALVKAYDWMQEWYREFREKTGLSEQEIQTRFNLIDLIGSMSNTRLVLPQDFIIKTDKGEGHYIIHDFERSVASKMGQVSLIRIIRMYPESAPKGEPEGAMVMTPVGDYSQAVAMSMGWRLGESPVVYMNLNSQDEQIINVNQSTAHNILFKAPSSQPRMDTQTFGSVFHRKNGSLASWDVTLYPDKKLSEARFKFASDGMKVIVGDKRHSYHFPESVDMPTAIENVISQKPAIS